MPIANANSEAGEPNDIQAQIAQLREQVDALMKENEPQAAGGATCTESTICGAIRATRRRTELLIQYSSATSPRAADRRRDRHPSRPGTAVSRDRGTGLGALPFLCRKRWFRSWNRLGMRRQFNRRRRGGMRVRLRVGRPVQRLPLA